MHIANSNKGPFVLAAGIQEDYYEGKALLEWQYCELVIIMTSKGEVRKAFCQIYLQLI